MRVIKNILLFFATVLISLGVYSQTSLYIVKPSLGKCFEIGFNMGVSQYRGEYQGLKSAVKNFDFNLGYSVNARFNFNSAYWKHSLPYFFDKRLVLRLSFSSLAGSSEADTYDKGMQLDIREFAALGELNFLKYTTLRDIVADSYIWTPYVLVGIGYAGFKCDNSEKLIHDDGFTFKFSTIFGGGLKFTLIEGLSLNAEGAYRISFADDIDYNENNSRNDQYYFISVGISANLSELFSHKNM